MMVRFEDLTKNSTRMRVLAGLKWFLGSRDTLKNERLAASAPLPRVPRTKYALTRKRVPSGTVNLVVSRMLFNPSVHINNAACALRLSDVDTIHRPEASTTALTKDFAYSSVRCNTV